jgi:hypothetical protein
MIMWFAKLFGGREDDNSEPSEFPPHPAANAPKPTPVAVRPQPQHDSSSSKKTRPAKGFDPYNSGEFDKHKAWERVIR